MDAHRIPGMPPTMYYIPNFITPDEEAHILASIPSNRWISLSHRRLQAIPCRLTATNTLLPAPLPPWLVSPVVERIQGLEGVFERVPHGINHCLINEYLPGQGIMPHEDGGAYFPVVATVSLGGSIVLDVTAKTQDSDADPDSEVAEPTEREKPSWRIFQEPRSLLLTTGSAYTDTLHGIAEVAEDVDLNERTVANWGLLGDREAIVASGGRNERTTRVSLTLRDVKKVSAVGSKIFGKARPGAGR